MLLRLHLKSVKINISIVPHLFIWQPGQQMLGAIIIPGRFCLCN